MQRALTNEEAAALQSFPSTFSFDGASLSAAREMIGNAQPPLLGFHMSELWRRLHALAACLYARCHALLCEYMPSSPQHIPDEFRGCLSRALLEARHLCPVVVPCFSLTLTPHDFSPPPSRSALDWK